MAPTKPKRKGDDDGRSRDSATPNSTSPNKRARTSSTHAQHRHTPDTAAATARAKETPHQRTTLTEKKPTKERAGEEAGEGGGGGSGGAVHTPLEQNWIVVRLAAKSETYRRENGRGNSDPKKPAHESLHVKKDGCYYSDKRTGMLAWLSKEKIVSDFNYYRFRGAPQPAQERAVSICTVDTYDILREKLPGAGVENGSIGENILIQGPPSLSSSSSGIQVGMRLQLGPKVVIEVCHINNPCYRLLNVPWSKVAAEKYDHVRTDDNGNVLQEWFRHPDLPLNHKTHPGGRGLLAKVLVEGSVNVGDKVTVLS